MQLFFPLALVLGVSAPAWVPAARWYRTARELGARSPFLGTVAMRIRRVRPADVYRPVHRAREAGVSLDLATAEAHLMAGGTLGRVADALVLARRTGLQLDVLHAMTLDLAGKDVVELVRGGPRTPDGRLDLARIFPRGAQEQQLATSFFATS